MLHALICSDWNKQRGKTQQGTAIFFISLLFWLILTDGGSDKPVLYGKPMWTIQHIDEVVCRIQRADSRPRNSSIYKYSIKIARVIDREGQMKNVQTSGQFKIWVYSLCFVQVQHHLHDNHLLSPHGLHVLHLLQVRCDHNDVAENNPLPVLSRAHLTFIG